MSLFVAKARMDHHEVHVAPPPVHVDLVDQLEPIVGQNSRQGTGDAVSQGLGCRCHALNIEACTIAGKECHRSPPHRVWSNEQLELLSVRETEGSNPCSGSLVTRLGPSRSRATADHSGQNGRSGIRL